MSIDSDHITILLDIKSEIGALGARMMNADHSRNRIEQSIDELKKTVSEIHPVVSVVAVMKPDVDDLVKFKSRLGAYIWVAGLIASGALWLLWQGILLFSDNIKSAATKFFH